MRRVLVEEGRAHDPYLRYQQIQPTNQPTKQPSNQPTKQPTNQTALNPLRKKASH